MVRLIINGQEFTNFVINDLTLIYNAITSTFGFSGLDNYAPKPLTYPKIEIFHDDELILTGTILNQSTVDEEKPTLVSVSGYSKAGVLDDCTIPLSAMPMQLDNMSLKEICGKLLPLYDLKFTFENSVADLMNKKFEKVNFDYDKTLKSIIVELATERGIFVNHTAKGEIRFTDSSASNLKIVDHFEDLGTMKIDLDINGQSMHSEISMLSGTDDGSITEGEITLKNPYCTAKRPIIYKMTTGDSVDIKEAVRLKLSSELRGIVLKIETTKFIKPGNLITISSERLKIRNRVAFFVEQTSIKQDKDSLKYEMDCVLKDVYTKSEVKNELR